MLFRHECCTCNTLQPRELMFIGTKSFRAPTDLVLMGVRQLSEHLIHIHTTNSQWIRTGSSDPSNLESTFREILIYSNISKVQISILQKFGSISGLLGGAMHQKQQTGTLLHWVRLISVNYWWELSICLCCPKLVLKTGKMGNCKHLSDFDKSQIVMARQRSQCISKTAGLVEVFPVCCG